LKIIKVSPRLSLLGLLVFLICFSCNNRSRELEVQENITRLVQQNTILKKRNNALESELNSEIERYLFEGATDLNKILSDFHERTDTLLQSIDSLIKQAPAALPRSVLTQYNSFATAFDTLNKRFRIYASGEADFKEPNLKDFLLKYIERSDSLTRVNKLVLLKTDILIAQHRILESILKFTVGCNFGVWHKTTSFAISKEPFYKRGDTLDIRAVVVHYATDFQGMAVIEGKQVKPKQGFFEYSRIIREKPGRYTVPIKITFKNVYGVNDTLPAKVDFIVK